MGEHCTHLNESECDGQYHDHSRDTFVFELSALELGFLKAAVTDFYHKMRASMDDDLITWVSDDDYAAAKYLWKIVVDDFET